MNVKDAIDEITKVLGKNRVTTEKNVLKAYSMDQSFTRPCMPDAVVFVENVEQVQNIVKITNKYSVPIIPYSSGMNLRGATIPSQGGIILNLTKMNKILQISLRERWVFIESGVTYSQLVDELKKYNLRVMIPFGTPPSRSVVSSIIEDEPTLAAASFEYGNTLYMDLEIVLPTGELVRIGKGMVFVDGEWISPGGGGVYGHQNVYCWLWQAAQGTLGVVTKMVVKAEHLPKVRKIFFLTFDELKNSVEPIRRIQRKEIGLECFAVNNFNLAAILTKEWKIPEKFPCEIQPSKEFEDLREKLPRWTYIIHLVGLPYFPEEKVSYEELDLNETCEEFNIKPKINIPNTEETEKVMLNEILKPWAVLKKANYKGSFHSVCFYTTMDKIQNFEEAIHDLAKTYKYPVKDIGGYILPVERARNCYCEFEFYCNLNDSEEAEKVKNLWINAHELVADMGGVLAKPYGPISEIVYRRVDPVYFEKLREIKKKLDPNNIMNPGKLCFT